MAKRKYMPAKSSLALYMGKGGQRTPMGLKLTWGRSIKEMTCRHAKQEIEVQFLL